MLIWWDNLGDKKYYPVALSRDLTMLNLYSVYLYRKSGRPAYYYFPKANRFGGSSWISSGYGIEEDYGDSIDVFRFNDGVTGFVIRQEYLQSAWGVGPCGACLHEEWSYYRLENGRPKLIFSLDYNSGNIETMWPRALEIEEELNPALSKITFDNKADELIIPVTSGEAINEVDIERVLRIGWDENWQPVLRD